MSGDFQLGDTIYIPFTTRAFATGIPTVLAGTPVVTGSRDANLTQFTTGITLDVSFDGVVGLNLITIVATGGNSYVSGETYTLYLTAGQVDSVSVIGEVVGHFTLEIAPVNWNRVTAPTTAVDLSGTDIQLVDTAAAVTTVNGLAANVITAASINAAAFTAAKFGADFITVTSLAPGCIVKGDQLTGLNDLAATAILSSGSALNTTGGTLDLVTDITTKTGYALTTADHQLIRDEMLPTQNATFSDIPFLFVDSTDHVTPVTGASTITITRSLDGAAFGAVSGTTVTEIGNGMYHIDASAADMNAGQIVFRIAATGGTPNAPDDAFVSIRTTGGV